MKVMPVYEVYVFKNVKKVTASKNALKIYILFYLLKRTIKIKPCIRNFRFNTHNSALSEIYDEIIAFRCIKNCSKLTRKAESIVSINNHWQNSICNLLFINIFFSPNHHNLVYLSSRKCPFLWSDLLKTPSHCFGYRLDSYL